MKIAFTILVFTLVVPRGFNSNAHSTPSFTPLPAPVATATLTPASVAFGRCTLNGRPVGDIGQAIAQLVGPASTLTVTGECPQAEQIAVNGGQTLVLTHAHIHPTTAVTPVLLKSTGTIAGDTWDTAIIDESTAKGQFTIIAGYNSEHPMNGYSYVGTDTKLTIRNLQLKGTQQGFNSAPAALYCGNCHDSTIDHVWVNATRSIGINVGGLSQLGNYAANVRVTNCRFTSVAAENLGLTNGQDITFDNNEFINPGQAGGPGSTAIDLEPNIPGDRIIRAAVTHCTIDASTGTVTANDGIVVQVGGGRPADVHDITVADNRIIGGNNNPARPITNIIAIGIAVFGANNVTARRNEVTRTGQHCFYALGARHLTYADGTCTDTSGGGNPGAALQDVTDAVITGNKFRYTGTGPADNRLLISGSSVVTTVSGNEGFEVISPQRPRGQ
jgi:hypothetical protein